MRIVKIILTVILLLSICSTCLIGNYAATAFLIALLLCELFIIGIERAELTPRLLMPVISMSTIAAVGRILLAPFPNFKPTLAIVIISGISLGKHAGFLTGMLAAISSNFFFGHGPWTPWQMLGFGIGGYLSGCLMRNTEKELLSETTNKKRLLTYFKLSSFGLVAGIIYGLITNIWSAIGFLNELSFGSILVFLAASIPFDTLHIVSTIVFLIILSKTFLKKLARIKIKLDLLSD